MRLSIVLMGLFLLSQLALAQESINPQPLIPYESIYSGEEIVLKTRLVYPTGQPVLNAEVKAYTDFSPTVYLYDDGEHEDEGTGDGIYANTVMNAPEGTHIITIQYKKGNFSDSTQYPLKVVPRPSYKEFAYVGIAILFLIPVGIVVWKKISVKLKLKSRAMDLETRRKTLEEMAKKAERAYFNRKIDEKTFIKRTEEYRQEMDSIDVELKNLKK